MTDRTHPDSGRIITSGDVIAELHDRIAELEAQLEAVGAGGAQDSEDAARLLFASEFDGFDGDPKDKYDHAMDVASENGREEPTPDDELNGLRRLIDGAMARARQKGGEPA